MTKIEWCDEVWNVITGCSPVSEGCDHCYAQKIATTRLGGRYGYPKERPFRVTFHDYNITLPFNWKKPRRIFIDSMGDFFHDDVKLRWIDDVLDVILTLPQHTFIVLTKRPQNIEYKLWGLDMTEPETTCRELGGGDYLENLWIGVSVESSKYLNRIEILKETKPIARRIISFEPLLDKSMDGLNLEGIDWVIVGGETGPGARPLYIPAVVDIYKMSEV